MESILAGERLFFVEEQLGDEITLGRLEKAAKVSTASKCH